MNNPASIKPTLQESVQSAINKSGFVLEMKVARLLKDNDLTPYQSVYCTNEKLDIEREVDLVATKIAVICND